MAQRYFVLLVALAVCGGSVMAGPCGHKKSADIITAQSISGAEGAGWAGENHNVAVHAGGNSGASGWGWGSGSGWPSSGSAQTVYFDSHGDAELGNQAAGLQASSQSSEDVSAMQAANANNVGGASESLDLSGSGGELTVVSSGNAGVGGSGIIGVAGFIDIHADGPPAPNVGLVKP